MEEIKKLVLSEGDIIVIKTDYVTDEVCDRIRNTFPVGTKVLFLSIDSEVSVLTKEQLKQLSE